MITEDNTTFYNNCISNIPPEECGCWSLVTTSSAMITFQKVLLGAVLVPYMAAGLPANLWLVWAITRANKDLLAAEFFVLNVALCDTLFMLAIPLSLLCVYDPFGSGPFVFTLLEELWVFVWMGRPLFQCCICLERYLAVVRPFTFIRFKPLRFKVALSGVVWVAVMVSLASRWKLKVQYTLTAAVSPAVPLPIILFFCLSVLWSLKRPGPGETKRTGGDPMKRRAFNIILLNLAMLLTTYLPLLVILPFLGVLSLLNFHIIYYSFLYLAVVCGLVQPLYYVYKARKLTCS